MRFLLLLALAAAPALAHAQIGIRAGLNVADLVGDDADNDFEGAGIDEQPRLGLAAGVSYDLAFTPTLGARVEAIYSQKGAKATVDAIEIDGEEITAGGSITTRLDYVEVPILLTAGTTTASGLEIRGFAGPALGFEINTGVSCSGDIEDGCDFEGEDGTRALDLGAAVGASVGAGPFAVDLRFTRSLRSVAKELEGPGTPEIFNSVFTVSGVYRIGR